MDVFISYSRKDHTPGTGGEQDVIARILQVLKDNGISYWLDENGIHSGEAFATVLSHNIAECKIFLFVSSINSNASRWTCGEVATASSYRKRIIPFKIDQSPYNPSITIYLAALDTIDYVAEPDKALQRLVKSVKLYLAELEEAAFVAEQEDVEAQIQALNTRINMLVEEKKQLLTDLATVRAQIAGHNDTSIITQKKKKRK